MLRTEYQNFKVIKEEEITKYLEHGKDFIDQIDINDVLNRNTDFDRVKFYEILNKALEIETLTPDETAFLLNIKEDEYWEEIYETAKKIKKKVYDNRIVTFAPLYCSNLCINNCVYCGFRKDNKKEIRKKLSIEEVKKETEALVKMGHKRLILVYGEHPESNIDYIVDTINAVYSVKIKTKRGFNSIRRVNINCAPLCIDDLKKMKEAGIGTYQVFQETYNKEMYKKLHPSGIKANFRWRLYSLHRAMDAGIDDVAIGSLFGLYNWKYDVIGMVVHARDLEKHFNIGPHTVSFPRLTPALGSEFSVNSKYKVNDSDFKKLVAVLRLAIPYSGMIITAREPKRIRDEIIPIGCTQTDASTRIGIGAYSKEYKEQKKEIQQFELGDTRTLEELIKDLAEQGMITSFCTAGYRCGRTGDKIMGLLKKGHEGKFCKLNAVLTFQEWLDDFASEETKEMGKKLIEKEIEEIKKDKFFIKSNLIPVFEKYFEEIKNGKRDLYI